MVILVLVASTTGTVTHRLAFVSLLLFLLFLLLCLVQQLQQSCAFSGYDSSPRIIRRRRKQRHPTTGIPPLRNTIPRVVQHSTLLPNILHHPPPQQRNENNRRRTPHHQCKRLQPVLALALQQDDISERTGCNNSNNNSDNNNSNNNNSNTTEYSLSQQSLRLAQYGYTIASVMVFAIPDCTMTTKLATKWGSAAGFAMAARLCFLLRKASAMEGRWQSSDTYQRLRIGLLGFNVIGVLAIPGEAAFVSSFYNHWISRLVVILLTSVRLLATTMVWNGWIQTVRAKTTTPTFTSTTIDTTATNNNSNVINSNNNSNNNDDNSISLIRMAIVELWRGIQDTIIGLKVQSAKKALTYRNCFLLVVGGFISNGMEGLFHWRYQTEFARTWFDITLHWSNMSRLFLIATMIYTLKDAAERDRLTGTTFIELNTMIGIWAMLVGLGQAIHPFGFEAYRGVLMYAFAIPFLLRAYKSQKEKQISTTTVQKKLMDK